jgi:hypothetical protein
MRIRMTEPRTSQVDGVNLSVFHPGHIYEVDASIATFLIVSGVAEPCDEQSPALVVSTNEVMVGVFVGAAPPIADVSDDWEDDGPTPDSAA